MTGLPAVADKTFLGNIKVRTKILGGSGVILAALAAVGGIACLSFSWVTADFEQFSKAAELGNFSKELAGDFAGLNGDANEFLLTGDAAILAKAEEQTKEMADSIDGAKSI